MCEEEWGDAAAVVETLNEREMFFNLVPQETQGKNEMNLRLHTEKWIIDAWEYLTEGHCKMTFKAFFFGG